MEGLREPCNVFWTACGVGTGPSLPLSKLNASPKYQGGSRLKGTPRGQNTGEAGYVKEITWKINGKKRAEKVKEKEAKSFRSTETEKEPTKETTKEIQE